MKDPFLGSHITSLKRLDRSEININDEHDQILTVSALALVKYIFFMTFKGISYMAYSYSHSWFTKEENKINSSLSLTCLVLITPVSLIFMYQFCITSTFWLVNLIKIICCYDFVVKAVCSEKKNFFIFKKIYRTNLSTASQYYFLPID